MWFIYRIHQTVKQTFRNNKNNMFPTGLHCLRHLSSHMPGGRQVQHWRRLQVALHGSAELLAVRDGHSMEGEIRMTWGLFLILGQTANHLNVYVKIQQVSSGRVRPVFYALVPAVSCLDISPAVFLLGFCSQPWHQRSLVLIVGGQTMIFLANFGIHAAKWHKNRVILVSVYYIYIYCSVMFFGDYLDSYKLELWN